MPPVLPCRTVAVLLLFLVVLLSGCNTGGVALALAAAGAGPRVLEVKGLDAAALSAAAALPDEQRQQLVQMWVASAPAGAPPLGGEVKTVADALIFQPRYPLQPGLTYRARFDGSALGQNKRLETTVSLPAAAPSPRVHVEEIYPSADALPENLLRFYIHFSGPMSRGDAYRHIHLLDDTGKQVPYPFLELAEELWNPEMTRFTLFFDPGRIKQGLVPRLEAGPALLAGKTYTLLIDADWQDAAHRPLTAPQRKVFRALAADGVQPDTKRWKLAPPRAGTRGALVVTFDKPLDHAMLQRVLTVEDSSGAPLKGKIIISDHEKRWEFTPDRPWGAGHHVVAVESILEDNAGNSLREPFEIDLNRPSGTAPHTSQFLELPFEVK